MLLSTHTYLMFLQCRSRRPGSTLAPPLATGDAGELLAHPVGRQDEEEDRGQSCPQEERHRLVGVQLQATLLAHRSCYAFGIGDVWSFCRAWSAVVYTELYTREEVCGVWRSEKNCTLIVSLPPRRVSETFEDDGSVFGEFDRLEWKRRNNPAVCWVPRICVP